MKKISRKSNLSSSFSVCCIVDILLHQALTQDLRVYYSHTSGESDSQMVVLWYLLFDKIQTLYMSDKTTDDLKPNRYCVLKVVNHIYNKFKNKKSKIRNNKMLLINL